MAFNIKLVGKDIYEHPEIFPGQEPGPSWKYYAISLQCVNSEGIAQNAVFKQTPTLTEAFAGITEYGALKFNGKNSDLSATVDIEAYLPNENETIVSQTTLADLADMVVSRNLPV